MRDHGVTETGCGRELRVKRTDRSGIAALTSSPIPPSPSAAAARAVARDRESCEGGAMKLPVVALLIAAACSSPSSPPKAPAEAPGRAQRFQIGALEAYALADGHLDLPNDGKLLGIGRSPDETADVLAAAGLPRDTIQLDIQCLLVKEGDRVILFDTGMGEASLATTGQLLQSLALAGVAPAAVTDIFISHAHSDHVGGLVTKGGALAFPAATIHLSAAEWAAFQAEAETDQDARRFVAAMGPKVAAFEPGAQVLPVVKAVATPGHTLGHSSYEIGTDADKVLYLGDVAHHSVLSLQPPTWSIEVDADQRVAEATRRATLAKLAADHARVFAGHFPFAGVGHVVADGEGFGWKPEAIDPS
jgi:glyoxylase-like metal-dependent hydrolase (beta-lactamase superfamily II)